MQPFQPSLHNTSFSLPSLQAQQVDGPHANIYHQHHPGTWQQTPTTTNINVFFLSCQMHTEPSIIMSTRSNPHAMQHPSEQSQLINSTKEARSLVRARRPQYHARNPIHPHRNTEIQTCYRNQECPGCKHLSLHSHWHYTSSLGPCWARHEWEGCPRPLHCSSKLPGQILPL